MANLFLRSKAWSPQPDQQAARRIMKSRRLTPKAADYDGYLHVTKSSCSAARAMSQPYGQSVTSPSGAKSVLS